MDIIAQPFDQELTLAELLRGVAPAKLVTALATLLGGDVRLVAADGAELAAGRPDTAPPDPLSNPRSNRTPLRHEFETIGFVESGVSEAHRVEAAAALVEMLLAANARYQMASRLHTEVVHADYESLQRKNTELAASEARYKALAGNLEERVAEQVKTIETAQRQLFQAEKMAAVGQLAAGMAHEINNPIGFVRSNLATAGGYLARLDQLARTARASGDPAVLAYWRKEDMDFVLGDFAALLNESVSGADRIAAIVADLKEFSNIDHAEQQLADINACVRSVCKVAASRMAGRAEVVLALGEIPMVRCRPGHINQVLLNLLLNAAQAMDEPGQVRIATTAEGDGVRIEIADNGRGIAPDVLPRIFDPFFTTRAVGQGTGLGLTVARDVLAAHGGAIAVESELGRGTTFSIHLPSSTGSSGEAAMP